MTDRSARFLGWQMVALAFLALNVGSFLPGGAYGAIAHDLEHRFALNRGTVSLAISAQLFAFNLSAPLSGWLVGRFSLRKLMIAAAAIEGTAYLGMGLATNFTEIVVCYAFNGLGGCILGAIAPYTLVSRWFEADRSKALGFMSIPVTLLVAPPVAAAIATTYGSRGVFFVISGIFYLLLPALLFVVNRPEDVGQTAWKGDGTAVPEATLVSASGGVRLTNRNLLGMWQFWLLTLGYALLTGPAHVFVAHSMAYAMQRGNMTVATASMVMAAFGGAGLFGTVLCGWFADRLGAVRGLVLIAGGLALAWAALLLSSTIWPMVAVACVIGVLSTAIAAVHTSAVNDIFGKDNVPTVVGMTFFVRLPFLVAFPWLAGNLFDLTGNYVVPFSVQIVGYLLATAGFAAIARSRARATALAPAAAG